MPLALPEALLNQLTRSPLLLVGYILLLLTFAAMANADKLRAALRRPQQWEAERARWEANLKYWELQAYKKAEGFEDLPDPYSRPTPQVLSPSRAGEATPGRPLAFWERLGYAALGAYIGSATPLPQPREAAAPEAINYLGAILVVVATVLTTGLLVASLGRRIRVRVLLILAGVVGVPVVAALLALVIAGIYLVSGQPIPFAS